MILKYKYEKLVIKNWSWKKIKIFNFSVIFGFDIFEFIWFNLLPKWFNIYFKFDFFTYYFFSTL